MVASTSSSFLHASGTRRRTFGFANVLSLLGLLFLTAEIALPQTAVRAQTGDTAKLAAPTAVLHLRAADAAPTFAALHQRLLTRLKLRGEVTAQQSGESHVIRFSRKTTGHILTAAERDDVRKKYAAAHPVSLAQKQAVETMKMTDNATLMKVAKKGQVDPGLYKIIAAQMASEFQPLQASLSPNHPYEASGRAYLTFVSPKTYDKATNVMTFQNDYYPYGVTAGQSTTFTMPNLPGDSDKKSPSSSFTMPSFSETFTPSSYLHLEMKARAGSMYLFSVKASWQISNSPIDIDSPFGGSDDSLLILCGDSGLSALVGTGGSKAQDDSGAIKTIPKGVADTPMVVLCDQGGWYDITIAGITNPWEFRGVSIKEISAD